jgi:hypothetical protein
MFWMLIEANIVLHYSSSLLIVTEYDAPTYSLDAASSLEHAVHASAVNHELQRRDLIPWLPVRATGFACIPSGDNKQST